MSKKFFETEAFAKQQAEWNQKLAASGFVDIEATENGVVRPQVFTSKKTQYVGGADYFEFCQLLLRNYPFTADNKGDLYRKIFELHAEGRPAQEIADHLAKNEYRSYTKRRVNQIIDEIKENFGRL